MLKSITAYPAKNCQNSGMLIAFYPLSWCKSPTKIQFKDESTITFLGLSNVALCSRCHGTVFSTNSTRALIDSVNTPYYSAPPLCMILVYHWCYKLWYKLILAIFFAYDLCLLMSRLSYWGLDHAGLSVCTPWDNTLYKS